MCYCVCLKQFTENICSMKMTFFKSDICFLNMNIVWCILMFITVTFIQVLNWLKLLIMFFMFFNMLIHQFCTWMSQLNSNKVKINFDDKFKLSSLSKTWMLNEFLSEKHSIKWYNEAILILIMCDWKWQIINESK